MPKGVPTFSEALRAGREIFHHLKTVLKDRGLSTAVGDEGGFAPNFKSADDALATIVKAVEKAGYKVGEEIFIALDVAASEFYDEDEEAIRLQEVRWFEAQCRRVGFLLSDWQRSTPSSRSKTVAPRTIGTAGRNSPRPWARPRSSSVTTSSSRTWSFCARESNEGSANSILVKVNQIGSLTETLDAIELAKENRYTAVISHRSGETEDTTIADIAVATNAGQIKTGSLSRTDRVAKYNQLLRIEEDARRRRRLRRENAVTPRSLCNTHAINFNPKRAESSRKLPIPHTCFQPQVKETL